MAFPAPVFDPRAVIEGRSPGRTRVGLIVGMVIAAACALVMLLIYAAESELRGHSELPFLIALPFALLPVPLLVALVLLVDRLEPEPRVNLIFAFMWGAGVAALVAVLINTLGLEFVTMPALGKSAGQYVSATFGAPPVEETLKGLVLILLLRLRRQELDGPTDGIIYAAMVGLGFAMMENISYYIDALLKPEIGGAKLLGLTFVMRGVLSPFAHPIFTSMTGIGVAYAASHRRAGVGDTAGPVRCDAAPRHVERPVGARPARPWRRLRSPLLRFHRAEWCPGARPAPDRVADQAMSSRLRAHRPGDTAGHRNAEHAAWPPDRTLLGAQERGEAGGGSDDRLSACRDRTGHAASAGRARRDLPVGVRGAAAGTARVDADGTSRVPEPQAPATGPAVGAARPIRVYPAAGISRAGSTARPSRVWPAPWNHPSPPDQPWGAPST